jgi:hypothetical protein
MTLNLSSEQRCALAQADPSDVLTVVDPETATSYVIMRAELYERFRKATDDSSHEIREAYPLMDAAARAAGWDDPAEDLYDDLDPRRPT